MSQAEIDPPTAAGGLLRQLRAVRTEPGLFWTVAALAYLPLLVLYFQWLWKFEHHQFFPLLLAGVGYLVWTRVGRPLLFPRGAIAWVLLAISLCLLVASSVFYSPRVAAFGCLFLAASFLQTHNRFYLWVPLILLIRLPLGYDQRIILGLQGVTTRISSFLLDLMRVPHLAAGNTIELPDRELFVAEACSGVQSAFTIAFVALFVSAWQRRPLFLVPLYLLISLVWAVLCNTVRVTAIACAAYRFDVDLSTGWMHDAIGYASLALAILLTFSSDALLMLWFRPINYRDSDADNPVLLAWNWLLRQRSDDHGGQPLGSAQAPPSGGARAGAGRSNAWNAWTEATSLSRMQPRLGLTALTAVVAGVSAVAFAANSVLGDTRVVNAAGEVLISPQADLLDELPGPAQFVFVDSMGLLI
jgi:exosortase